MTDLIKRLRERGAHFIGDDFKMCREAADELERLTAECDALLAALVELVACKDLRDKACRGVTTAGDAEARGMCASFQERESAFAEYERRQPLAWAAARSIVAARKEKP